MKIRILLFSLLIAFSSYAQLSVLYQETACGLNYTQFSTKVTNRHSTGGTGSGFPTNLTVSGIDPCYIIKKAYLWYAGSFASGSPKAPPYFDNCPIRKCLE